MPTTYPRLLTYQEGELAATLEQMGNPPERASQIAGWLKSSEGATSGNTTGGSRLIKSHTCAVVFPDNVSGHCTYTRFGPAFHRFQFQHGGDGTGFSPVALPRFHWSHTLGNDLASLEAKIKELTEQVYLMAALWEQRDYFRRASEGAGRKKHPQRFRMTAARAQATAGRYALCQRMDSGQGLIPLSRSYEHLVEVNTLWMEKRDPHTVVACCNRLDRCWELPRFNPLYGIFDPRPRQPEGGCHEQAS